MVIFTKLQILKKDRRFYLAPEFQPLKSGEWHDFIEMFNYDEIMRRQLWQVVRVAERKAKPALYAPVINMCILRTKQRISFVQVLWRIASREAKEYKKLIWVAYKKLVDMQNNLIKFKNTVNAKYLVAAIKAVE